MASHEGIDRRDPRWMGQMNRRALTGSGPGTSDPLIRERSASMKSRSLCRRMGIIALIALISPGMWAQKTKDTGPKYDRTQEVKIKGTVEEVREVAGQWEGTHLVVKTSTSTVLVHVGPSAFLKEMDTTFKPGDVVEVTGAKAPNTTEEEILAREVTVGNNTVVLRDDKGIPIWADWKPGK